MNALRKGAAAQLAIKHKFLHSKGRVIVAFSENAAGKKKLMPKMKKRSIIKNNLLA